ncbi:hypothetical protein OJAV_G00016330 [Oryzias javanicus]|uniref:Uncharacterized protein n=1 Tax=Oryzias javanicus TaxID=123683 RepID=A0A3S2QA57_ORYJA|nr:hypothetical protein OJAV_G00016330 [Oryzias javanicus]
MESTIGNACLKVVEEAAQTWENVDIAELYEGSSSLPTALLAGNLQVRGHADVSILEQTDSRRIAALIYPGPWLENTGRDLEIFPKQMSSNCCGIFMLMYALSICTSSEMTFTEGDMPAIRLWWCLQSMERFCTDGHGHRFAFWTEEASLLLQGTLQPVFKKYTVKMLHIFRTKFIIKN